MADREIAQFEKWLKKKYKLLEGKIYKLEAPESVPYRAADLVREASEMARRLGAGDLAVSKLESYQGGEVCGIHDALAVLGRMLHWCREQQRVEPLAVDVAGLADMLRVCERHVKALESSGRLPEALHLGRSVRWRVREIQAWVRAGAPPRQEWQLIWKGE